MSVGYGRISAARHDGASLIIQRQRYEQTCKALGFEDMGWFEDAGVSGSKVNRAGLNAALDRCKSVGGATIVTREISRIGRTTKLLERLKDAMADKAVLGIECWDGPSIADDAQGRFTLNILTSIAEKELEDTSSRIKARNAYNKANGVQHTGGSRPFGTETDKVTPRPDEVELIRDAVAHVLAGGSLTSLATRWRSEGRTTTTGKPWTYPLVRNMLMNDRLDKLVGDSARMARLEIESRHKGRTRVNVMVRWLNGALRCGECGEMFDSHNAKGPVYGCVRETGCAKVFVDALRAERLIEGFAKEMALPGVRADDGYAELLDERKAVEAKLTRVTDLFVEGTITKADHAKRKAELDALVGKIDADLLTRSASAAMAGSVDVWDTLDARQKRSVVLDLLGTAVVNKNRKRDSQGRAFFDPERFTWERPEVQRWWGRFIKSPVRPTVETVDVPVPSSFKLPKPGRDLANAKNR